MRILLVEPPDNPWVLGGGRLFVFEPLGLEYLAGALPGHDVRILDMRLDPDLDGALAEHRPQLVGFSAYTVHARTVRRLVARVKSHDRSSRVVIGGHHASVAPEACAWPGVDAVVPGEGVHPLADLVGAWEAGADGSRVAGVQLVRDGTLTPAIGRRAVALDDYPWPRRDLIAGLAGSYFSEWMAPIASVRTSRGCPYRCDFCSLWKTAEGRYYKRSVESVVEELERLEVPNVFFADDESLVDHRRMARLAEAILAAGIRKSYFMYGRADTVARHPELVALWRRAGMTRLFVGFEAAGDEELDRYNKGTSLDDNIRAIEVLKREGITINANFIVDPVWGPADFRRLERFVRRMDLEYPAFSILTPLPGTELHARERDRIDTPNTDLFDLIHPVTRPTMGYGRFYRAYLGLWGRSTSPAHRLRTLARYGTRRLPRVLADQAVLGAKALLTGLGYSVGLMQALHYGGAPPAGGIRMDLRQPAAH